MVIKIKIRYFKSAESIPDVLHIFVSASVYLHQCLNYDTRVQHAGDFSTIIVHPENRIKSYCYKVDGYLLTSFVRELNISPVYQYSLINHLEANDCKKIVLNFKLIPVKKEYLDYKWNERLLQLCYERRELDYTMALLSTLGGAFSALGDHYINCAHIAGQISLEQLKLAMRIGDPLTVARCKLYMSLSLIQLLKFKTAKNLILDQFKLAKNSSIIDFRLLNMCKGIWAKLKYEYRIYKQGKLLSKGHNENLKIKCI